MVRVLPFLLSAILLLQIASFAGEDEDDTASAPVVRRKITTLFSDEELASEQQSETASSAATVEPQTEPTAEPQAQAQPQIQPSTEAAAQPVSQTQIPVQPQAEAQAQIEPGPKSQPSQEPIQPKAQAKTKTKSKKQGSARAKSGFIKPKDPLDKEEVNAGISAIQKQVTYRDELEETRREAERAGGF